MRARAKRESPARSEHVTWKVVAAEANAPLKISRLENVGQITLCYEFLQFPDRRAAQKRPAAMCGPFRSSARGSARLAAQESRDFEMIVFRAAHDRGRTAMRIELRLPGRGGRGGRRRPAGVFP